jgi:hypothetical protein
MRIHGACIAIAQGQSTKFQQKSLYTKSFLSYRNTIAAHLHVIIKLSFISLFIFLRMEHYFGLFVFSQSINKSNSSSENEFSYGFTNDCLLLMI